MLTLQITDIQGKEYRDYILQAKNVTIFNGKVIGKVWKSCCCCCGCCWCCSSCCSYLARCAGRVEDLALLHEDADVAEVEAGLPEVESDQKATRIVDRWFH